MDNTNSLLISSNNTGKTQFDISSIEIVDGFVNLTKMARSQGREISRWLALPTAKRYIEALKEVHGKDVFHIARGNNSKIEQGTFGTREVALKVAQWISVDFEVWCNRQIDTLLQTGKVELPTQQPQSLPQTYKEALLALIGEVEKNEQLTLLSEANAPLVDFANQLLESSNGIDFGTSAKALNLPFGRNKLFAICREQGWLFGKNQPKQALVDEGYFVVLQTSYVQPNSGDRIITFKTLITAKGETWLVKKLKQLNIIT